MRRQVVRMGAQAHGAACLAAQGAVDKRPDVRNEPVPTGGEEIHLAPGRDVLVIEHGGLSRLNVAERSPEYRVGYPAEQVMTSSEEVREDGESMPDRTGRGRAKGTRHLDVVTGSKIPQP